MIRRVLSLGLLVVAGLLVPLQPVKAATTVIQTEKASDLTPEQRALAEKMNDLYARSLFSSVCLDRQRNLFLPFILSDAEKNARVKVFKSGCDCLTEYVVSKTTPEDVIGFVIQYFSPKPAGTSSTKPVVGKASLPSKQKEQFAKIWPALRDKAVRGSCGLSP